MNPETTAIFPKLSPLEGHLWARSGKNVGRRYSVSKVEQILGRSPACDIEVEDDRVSLQHAKIVTVDGRHHIFDLGSTNGTFVNDSRVEEAELRDGDLLQVGETVFEYMCNEERALVITLKGSQDSVVPAALREGAKQMLQRERHSSDLPTPVPVVGSGGSPREPGEGGGRGERSMPVVPAHSLSAIPILPAITHHGGTEPMPPLQAPYGASGLPGQGQAYGAQGYGSPALPAPYGSQNLPAPYGSPALPAPYGAPALPAPYGSQNLPVPYSPQAAMPAPYAPPATGDLGPPLSPIYAQAVPVEDGAEPEKQLSIADVIQKIRAVLDAFRPYWRSVAIGAVLGLALGGASVKILPPPQRAIFQMNIHTNAMENPVETTNSLTPHQNWVFFRAAEQNFVSPPVIKRTLTALGYTDIGDDAVKDIQDSLTFNKAGGGGIPGHPMTTTTNAYEGSFKRKSPDEALRYFEKHVKVYLESEVEKTLRNIQIQVDFLAKQLAEAQEELNRAEWELLEFKRKNIDAQPDQARAIYARVLELANRQSDLSQEAVREERALAHDQRRVLLEAPLEESQFSSPRPYEQAIASKQQELTLLESTGKGPQHPDVIKARSELVRLQELELEAESKQTSVKNINQSAKTARDTMATTEKNADLVKTHAAQVARELEEIRNRAADLPEREANYATLQRNFDNAKNTYQKLFDQEKATKLQLELERASATARYDIMVPVQLEVVNPLMSLLKRLVIGMVGGAVIAFGRAGFLLGRAHLKKLLAEAAAGEGGATPAPDTTARDLVVRS